MFAAIGFTSILSAAVAREHRGSGESWGQRSPVLPLGPSECRLMRRQREASGLVYLVFVGQFINGMLLPACTPSSLLSSSRTPTAAEAQSISPTFWRAAFRRRAGSSRRDGRECWAWVLLIVGLLLIFLSCLMWRMPETLEDALQRNSSSNSSSSAIPAEASPPKRRSSLVPGSASVKEGLRAFGRDAVIILKNRVWWLFGQGSWSGILCRWNQNYGPKIFSSYFSITRARRP